MAVIGTGSVLLDDILEGLGQATGPQTTPATRAPVDDTFSCAHTAKGNDFAFREVFAGGPGLGVGHHGAERFELLPSGNSAVLQAGKADGTLTAKVFLRDDPKGQGWVIRAIRRCTGPAGSAVPVKDKFELGAHGRPIPEPSELAWPDDSMYEPESTPVPLDDRGFYNRIGVVERRTLYAFETEDGLQINDFVGGQIRGSGSWSEPAPPSDTLGMDFIPTYGFIEPEHDFAGWAYYTSEPATLTAHLKDGTAVRAQRFRADDWRGTLHALLAPKGEIETVTLEQDGRTRTYEPHPG